MNLLYYLDADLEEYWQKVKTNLQASEVRLIFVADEIPAELRRVVEFLNQQMDPAEVTTVEIKQYVGQDSDFKTLVPRVIGQTVQAQQKKTGSARKGRMRDETSFFQELVSQVPEAVEPAKAIFEWAKSETSRIRWGRGKQYGAFSPTLDHKGTEHKPMQVWTDDSLSTWFGDMQGKPPFSNELKRFDLLRRLNEIPGVTITDKTVAKYQSIPLSLLNNEDALNQLLETLDWFVQEVEAL